MKTLLLKNLSLNRCSAAYGKNFSLVRTWKFSSNRNFFSFSKLSLLRQITNTL